MISTYLASTLTSDLKKLMNCEVAVRKILSETAMF
jgi:hypothetical protein